MADEPTQQAEDQSQSIDYRALAAEIGRQQRQIAAQAGAQHSPAMVGELLDPEEDVNPTSHADVLDYFQRRFPDSHPALHHRMKNGAICKNFPEMAYAMGGVAYGEADEQTWQRLIAQALPHWQAIHRPDPAMETPVDASEADILRNRVDQLEKMLHGILNGPTPALARG